MDFIIIGRKRKGNEYSWNILEFEYLEIFGKSKIQMYFERGARNYFWAFLGQRFMLVETVPTYCVTSDRVRRDPNSWNAMVFWSEWAVVSWVKFYRIEDVSIQTWFSFLFRGLA